MKSIKYYTDEEFLNKIGPKIGHGFQGSVCEFDSKDKHQVVKILSRYTFDKRDKTDDINKEITHGMYAGEKGIGPKVYSYRFIGEKAYIVMEKVSSVDVSTLNVDIVKKFLEKMIQHKMVNLDGTFAKTESNKLVMIDYGVSQIAKDAKEALEEYLTKSDYIYILERDYKLKGIYSHFSSYQPKES